MPNPSNSDLVGEARKPIGSQAMAVLYKHWAFEEYDTASQRRVKTFVLGLLDQYAELAQQLEQAREEIEEWKVEAERGKWPKERAQAFFRYGAALEQIEGFKYGIQSEIARAALTPDEGADPGGR